MIDPTDFERDCMAKALRPLGEYVAEIGTGQSLPRFNPRASPDADRSRRDDLHGRALQRLVRDSILDA